MTLTRKLKNLFSRPKPQPEWDFFLRQVQGVVHIGANTGQERDIYDRHGLNVVWIEPIPTVFAELTQNIARYSKQRAFACLLADEDGRQVSFKIANNAGASSSMLDIGDHKEIWPEVHYTDVIPLQTTTFRTLVAREGLDLSRYGALVLDTQGTELMVLKGAGELLAQFDFIKTEAADFEAYIGCCQVKDIDTYLGAQGFQQIRCTQFADHPKGGGYYDLVYARRGS